MAIMAKREIELASSEPRLSLRLESQLSHCTRAPPATADKFSGDQMFQAAEFNRKEKMIFEEKAPVAEPSAVEVERRWNLRVRRERVKVDGEWKSDSSPARTEKDLTSRKRERQPELSVSLSWREIEEDFTAILGHRLPRRPKKRPNAVQKELDCLFPGLALAKISPDLYKVDDGFESQKR